MIRNQLKLLGAAIVIGASPAARLSTEPVAQKQAGTIRIARIFTDGVVLQRSVPVRIWGWAQPNTSIKVQLKNKTLSTTARSDSSWQVTFPAQSVADSGSIIVTGGGTTITIRDVLFGDVWVASGQSNMEWKLSDSKGGTAEVASANDAQIRQFKIPNGWSWNPEKDLAGGSWASANPKTAGDFSGVAYFFAKSLRKNVGVPIGIINAAWSGAAIEPYISRSAQQLSDSAWQRIVDTETNYNRTVREALVAKLGELPSIDAGLANGAAPWASADLDESAWKLIAVPGAWERNGYPGLDGIVWLRTSFNLSANEARQMSSLTLGAVDDDDITWINGVEIGRTSGYFQRRQYSVPAGALREGRNVLAVRVSDGAGDGGIMANAGEPFLDVGGVKKVLSGSWKFRIGVASFREDAQHVNKIPTGAYNRMIKPILPFPIKGVIWYQGESNSNNDAQAIAYRAQFAALIQSWRKEWNAGATQFPFLWAQLPNYGTVDVNPPASGGWALVREAQSAALSLPNTAQAVIFDVGEATNLHPTNKTDVGERLALAARAVAYKQPIEFSGPVYRSHTIADGKFVVEFSHAAGLQLTNTRDERSEFAVAGADRKFVWANAKVDGDRVIVWSDEVRSPVYLRYAFSNSPQKATLYNGVHLPASPFRIGQ